MLKGKGFLKLDWNKEKKRNGGESVCMIGQLIEMYECSMDESKGEKRKKKGFLFFSIVGMLAWI